MEIASERLNQELSVLIDANPTSTFAAPKSDEKSELKWESDVAISFLRANRNFERSSLQ